MIDGVNLLCPDLDPVRWFNAPELLGVDGFPVEVMEHSGEVLNRKRVAKYQGLTFSVSPSLTAFVRCCLDGSLHKFKNRGLQNYDAFTLPELVAVVNDLESRFGIVAGRAELHGLEIGVNLMLTAYSPSRAIRAAIAHKDKPYVALFNRSNVKGALCSRFAYEIKIYHKGNQSGLSEPILRIEVKVKKMRFLHGYGLATLADLTDPAKVAPLVEVLLDALRQSVFIDPETDTVPLTIPERLTLETLRQPEKWAKMNFESRRTKRHQLARLLEKCNAFEIGKDLENRVRLEWQRLLKEPLEAKKNPAFLPILREIAVGAKPMFAPLECVGANMGFALSGGPTSTPPATAPKVRACISCGKDISRQRPQSRFCSEKYNNYGPARRCRNQDSNQRRTKRNQVMRAKDRNQNVRITYHGPEDQSGPYCETLQASEIAVCREWLDRVQRVEVLTDPAQILTDEEARDHLQRLTTGNRPRFKERMRSKSFK